MFPTRPTFDNMADLNKIFQRNTDYGLSPNYNSSPTSPLNQFGPPNRSSSSADSTSPELYSDNTLFSTPDRFMSIPSTPTRSDTPFARRRPIVGRKILSSTPEQPETVRTPLQKWEDMEFVKSIWQEEPTSSQSSNRSSYLIEQKKYTQNVFYELFPAENKGLELNQPVRDVTPPPPITPRAMVPYHAKPISPKFSVVPRTYNQEGWKLCTFCRKNGETPMVYMTHVVKEQIGNKVVVTCPILRSHVCMTCGATGDNAHTITYCPVLRHRNHGHPLQSTTITLKNTPLKSNGRKRY